MEWTFSQAEDDGEIVSELLDFYGYTIYLSPVIAFFPGFFPVLLFHHKQQFTRFTFCRHAQGNEKSVHREFLRSCRFNVTLLVDSGGKLIANVLSGHQ